MQVTFRYISPIIYGRKKQAFFEILFDAVHLVIVVTLGIIMIGGSKDRSQDRSGPCVSLLC